MNSEIEMQIRQAAAFKGMADAALKNGNMEQATEFMLKFHQGMKTVYQNNPDERTKKGWMTGAASVSLFFLQQEKYENAFPYSKEGFYLMKELFDANTSSVDNALGLLQMGTQLIMCCLELEDDESDEALDAFEIIDPIASSLESSFPDNEIVSKMLSTHQRIRDIFG